MKLLIVTNDVAISYRIGHFIWFCTSDVFIILNVLPVDALITTLISVFDFSINSSFGHSCFVSSKVHFVLHKHHEIVILRLLFSSDFSVFNSTFDFRDISEDLFPYNLIV